ncbi:type I-E CRISPR-associated protein Cas7/Cse4/CasC [bacterium]|nr:type I-E CRISPR-associated protein Cas7/Cse4/CasC [candidate division CSSED10-310 bacterium]
MSASGVKIEVHLIQNFAPSNLNRDDTGQPKSAFFGGFRRARVSSQCGKRAARSWWREHGVISVGERTKKLQQLICEGLERDEDFSLLEIHSETVRQAVRLFTDAYYAAADKKKQENTSVLIFVSSDEIQVCVESVKKIWFDQVTETVKKGKTVTETIKGLASLAEDVQAFDEKNAGSEHDAGAELTDDAEQLEGEEQDDRSRSKGKKKENRPKLTTDKEIMTQIMNAQISADIAMFGRMLAEKPKLNVEAACQVAHPISTHKVDLEMDFYTAVDDLNPAEETGAGMMGIVGFNSACFYRYAVVDRDQLARNLAGKTTKTNAKWDEDLDADDYLKADIVAKAFLEAMVFAIPTGKQNSFAAQNLPSFGLLVRRRGGVPMSLANAFAKPVRTTHDDDDLIGLSVDALTRHWDMMNRVYGDYGVRAVACFQVGQDEKRLNSLRHADKGTVLEAINAIFEGAAES